MTIEIGSSASKEKELQDLPTSLNTDKKHASTSQKLKEDLTETQQDSLIPTGEETKLG